MFSGYVDQHSSSVYRLPVISGDQKEGPGSFGWDCKSCNHGLQRVCHDDNSFLRMGWLVGLLSIILCSRFPFEILFTYMGHMDWLVDLLSIYSLLQLPFEILFTHMGTS